MELRLLEYFLTVVREENISRAAEVLHVTQPTLSRQMKELEDELHTTLFISGKSKTGKPWIMPKTSGKKFRKKVKAMKEWLYRHRDMPLKLIMKTVNIKLVGHYRYYGVSFNSRWIANYWFQTRELLFKILYRRSNRRSYTRVEFVDMLKYYPLATPKVYVSLFQ